MRVAAIYDIDGNIDALQAVLEEVSNEAVDRIVIGGDIAWGPFPAETVASICDLGDDAVAIRGNADREVASRAGESEGLHDWVAEVNTWCADQLSREECEFLAFLPESVSMSIDAIGDVLFCHGTPRSDEEVITPITPEEDVVAVLSQVNERTIVCGHTHSQFDRTVGDKRLVNAGSIGLPYEDRPGAYWALIGADVILRRTEYDTAAAAERVRASGCPHSDRFAAAIVFPIARSMAIENFEQQRGA